MTKEEWKQAEEALTHFFHPVELKVDGYDITLILERVSVYQNKIMVYIGGEFRGQRIAKCAAASCRSSGTTSSPANRGPSSNGCRSGGRRNCARSTPCNIPASPRSGHPFGR